MSAPRTNLEKQERRHKGPLGGMLAVVVFAGLLLLALGIWIAYDGNNPGDETDAPPATSPALTAPESATPGTEPAPVPVPVQPDSADPGTSTAPTITAPETTAPETTAPETTAPETTAPATGD